ncbi:MAG: response regulator [Clostridiaceae bacterium]|nr:response regulator [Clostridiaceae bacterium]
MRILVAEDEVTIAKALKVMLEKNKYSVDLVHNGMDALDYLTSTPYDALVLDIMMPGMDGLSVLSAARAQGVHTPPCSSPPRARSRTGWPGWTPGPTIISPSPLPRRSSWPGCGPSPAAASPMPPRS